MPRGQLIINLPIPTKIYPGGSGRGLNLVFGAIGKTGGNDGLRVMQQAIQQREGQGTVVVEDLRPLFADSTLENHSFDSHGPWTQFFSTESLARR